jgi:hypothetical protein
MEKIIYNIPEGCDKVSTEQIGNQLIVEFIPKVEELKDLDCYKMDCNGIDTYVIHNISKEQNYYCLVNSNKVHGNSTHLWDEEFKLRMPITREEMQAELAKHGKYFDFEEKVLKNLRWRSHKYGKYWRMNGEFQSIESSEDNDQIDKFRFDVGNYHQTKEQCEEYAKKMIELSKSLIK